jgi:D-alanine--poly(phosphoribitol) ligase subunit 2
MTSAVSDKVLQLLASVTESDEVFSNLDLPLYDYHVLDSLRTVQLIVAIENAFGLKVSPAAFDRESWGTPRKLVADIQDRLRA